MVETSPTDIRAKSQHPGVPKLVGIQYLRAFAAIAVVVFHAAQRYGVDLAEGARGVDVFFVVSGFIMWTLASTRPLAPTGFFIDRIMRIAPMYWLATFAVILAGVVGLVSGSQNDLSISSILKSLLFIPYIARGANEIWPILTPGWTLNYEMFFYAVFAAFLFAPHRFQLWGLTATFVCLILVGLAFRPHDPVLATYTDALLGHFIAGVWIAEAVKRGLIFPRIVSPIVLVVGILALYNIPGGGALITFCCGLASSLIVWSVVSMDVRQSIPTVPVILLAGNASYSIYLWHGFAIGIAGKVAAALGLPDWIAISLAVAGGIVAGLIVYKLLEDPLRRLFARTKRRVPA